MQNVGDISLFSEEKMKYLFSVANVIIKHHISFNAMTELLRDLKHLVSNFYPEVIENVDCSSLTITKITKHCISPAIKENLLDAIENQSFVLLLMIPQAFTATNIYAS